MGHLNPWKLRRKPDVVRVTVSESFGPAPTLTLAVHGFILDNDRAGTPHLLYIGPLATCPAYVLNHCPAWVLELAGWGDEKAPEDGEAPNLFTLHAQHDHPAV